MSASTPLTSTPNMPFATITVQPPEGLTTSAPFVPITEGLTYEEFERTLDILIYHRHHTCETLPLAPPALAPTIEGVRDALDELVFRSAGLAMEAARCDPKWEPVFSCKRMDIPFRGMYQGITEAQHISELYRVYHLKHNDHWTPYNYSHPDVLERRMYDQPDIEQNAFLGGYIWQISETTTAALVFPTLLPQKDSGLTLSPALLIAFKLWRFKSTTSSFTLFVCTLWFSATMPRPTPIPPMSASQATCAAPRLWWELIAIGCDLWVNLSLPLQRIGFQMMPDVGNEAMMADDEESVSSPEWVVNDTYKLPPLLSQDPSAEVSDFELDAEPAAEPPAAAEPAFGTWGSEIDPTFFGSSPAEWAAAAAQAGPEDWPGYQVLSRMPSATDSGYTTPDGTVGWVDEIEHDSCLIQNALNRLEELMVMQLVTYLQSGQAFTDLSYSQFMDLVSQLELVGIAL
ncbi:hypothetical protein CTheo_8918 [Ceratobasidium theobromae]|uniref:Uncharacterized protein n=1 Tax=Ceratobasidium theobromae TaxID=1582974 RepID=A0A5N5Q828_9AGAM|nr:hypothetical protein CTheo_8918 [Ceratobasidium theobromae]